jgi:predicted permease
MRFVRRLLNVVRPGAAESELARELAAHLTIAADEFERRGLPPDEARAAARRAIGSTAHIADRHRDARSFPWLDDGRRDIAHAARLLRRDPIFAATAVLSLAIGIGANTTVFTLVHALLFRSPAGVADAARLVDIGGTRNGAGFGTISYPDYRDLRDRATMLDGVFAHSLFPHAMSLHVDSTSAIDGVFGVYATTNYFTVLGTTAAAGRLFQAADGEPPGHSPVVVLSHRFWTRRFHADPAIVGRSLMVNGRALTVVGVASEGFQGTGVRNCDLWVPLAMLAVGSPTGLAMLESRSSSFLLAGARLKAGVSLRQAAAETTAIGRALSLEYPAQNRDRGLAAAALSPVPGSRIAVAAFLALLTAIVALVLTIACANLAGVLLARAAARRQEIAVRLAIGAGRARLVRQLLAETFMLFALGAAAGLLLARAATSSIVAALPALPFPVDLSLALDGRAIAFTACVSLGAALLCGLMPALHASKGDVVAALKKDAQAASGLRLRHAFVVAQVALSLLLVVVAGLFVRGLQAAGATRPGFDPDGVELAALDLSQAGYTEATGRRVAGELLEGVRALPDVEMATMALSLPGGFESQRRLVAVPGVAAPDGQRFSDVDWNVVAPGYFATLRIPLLTGRDFTSADDAGAQNVAIVGEGIARQFWPGQEAVGKYLLQPANGPRAASQPTRTLRVVGVAHDVKVNSLIDGPARSLVYVPLMQQYTPAFTIAARATHGQRLATEIRSKVAMVNPSLAVLSAQTLAQSAALGLVPQRVAMSVSGGLGLVGVLLAAIGIYGVTAYAVARRTREFGIRIALGAKRADLMRLILRQGLSIAIVGSAIGLTAAAMASRVLVVFLAGAQPLDPAVFGGAAALFIGVALAACYEPARRATKVDPLAALRCE